MAKQIHNETMDQQRKAREEFLALKKMQSGQQQPEPKPSEIAITPKTPGEKAANFWFHYKWVVIAGLITAVILAVLVAQCAGRVDYDLKVVLSCRTPLMDAETNKITAYLEPFCTDTNGDGEVHLQVVNCSYSETDGNTQYQYTMATRVQAILAADADALLFLTDQPAYDSLQALADGGMFEDNTCLLGEAFYAACQTENGIKLPEGLRLSCRKIDGMTIEKNQKAKQYYEAAQKILAAVQEQQTVKD
ncbi:MAG: hypothetical protein IKI29_03670 [Clostridia bacterium]|nr:hypothetical protein [Clostridia bacterium]